MNSVRRALKRLVRYWLRHPSPVGHTARVIYRLYHRLIVDYYVWRNTRRHVTALPVDPFEILWTDPAKITRWVVGMRGVPRTSWRRIGSIEEGDWDLNLGEFADLESYRGLRERFVEAKPWRDTVLFRTVTDRLARGTVEWGCLTADQFAERCSEIDVLYEAIRTSGYRSQKELFASGRRGDPISHIQLDATLRLVDEIAVCIGRAGEFLLADGQHRLSLAKLLQLRAVPVRVVIRHAHWQTFREQLAAFIRTEMNDRLPHALPHPDLNWKPSGFRSAAWFQLLRDHTAFATGTLLEADAGISGYFASRFDQCGLRCSALELDAARAEWLSRVRDANGDTFEVITSHEQLGERRFDLVVWANTADHEPQQFTRRVTELAAYAKTEFWLLHSRGDAAGSDTSHSLEKTETLLREHLGFAEFTIIECSSDSAHVLIKASRAAAIIAPEYDRLEAVAVRNAQVAAGELLPAAAASVRPLPLREIQISEATSQSRRLRVLVSAYACSPHRGSEPGIGWNNARQAARGNEVWVITRPVFRAPIEAELHRDPAPQLHPVYYDLPKWMQLLGPKFGYYLWQIAVYPLARRLHNVHRFDVTHHVSYVRSWSPSLLSLLPVPFIWGPVGGGELVPRSFRQGLSPRGRIEELQRDLTGWLSLFDPLLRYTARRNVLTIANSEDTAERVKRIGARRVIIMGESCLDELPLEYGSGEPYLRTGPVRFGSMTRLVYWKGLHLALEAFAGVADPRAEYWIIGEGAEAKHLRNLAENLGIAEKVVFKEGLSRKEWMAALRQIDALLHPSICNTGNAITIEAMAAGRPVVCLDRGGAGMQVTEATGFKIPAHTPEEAVTGLRQAMIAIIADREGAAAMGRSAREWAQNFSWKRRGELIQSLYEEAAGSPRRMIGVPQPVDSPPSRPHPRQNPRLVKTG